jgi:hypothetical protein
VSTPGVTTGRQIRTVALPAWSTIAAAVEGMQLQACQGSVTAIGLVDGLDVEQPSPPARRSAPSRCWPGRSTTAAVEGMQLQGHRVVNQGSATVGRGPGHRRG